MAHILGIDVGGSGIKAALVDTLSGELVSERHRVATPHPSTPANMAAAIRELVGTFDYDGIVGCCFPTIVMHGVAKSASNLGEAWRNMPVDATFSDATGLPFVAINDADAAAMAEMQMGAGRGLDGLVLTLTVGTGIGSGLFYDGVLVPNIEAGHMPGKDGRPIERYASDRARKLDKLDWREWGERFNYMLGRVVRVFSPDDIILGGGVSKKFDKYSDAIDVDARIHIAKFRNNAGIIGAALEAGSHA
jgi:polyphosphate glucokinase